VTTRNLGLTLADYRALARFRRVLRQFLAFSDRAAREAGLESQQHQLLLAVKGLPEDDQPPTIGKLAAWLQLQHHTAVELVDRASAHGLVRRAPDAQDRRRVLVQLTPRGEAVLRELSVVHHAELLSAAPALLAALQDVLAPTVVRQAAEVAWLSSGGALNMEDPKMEEEFIETVDVWELHTMRWPFLRALFPEFVSKRELVAYERRLLATARWSVIRAAPKPSTSIGPAGHIYDVYGTPAALVSTSR